MEKESVKENIVYEVEKAKIFYSREDDAEFVGIKLTSGQKFDIEGWVHDINIGSKLIETNIFIMDKRNFIYPRREGTKNINFDKKKLFQAIARYNAKPDSKIQIVTEDEFTQIQKQHRDNFSSQPIQEEITNIDITKLEVINDRYNDVMLITLGSGNFFAFDGRVVGNYVDGIINYTNAFVIEDGIYPCDEYGTAIYDPTVLQNEYVNKGFLCEVSQDDDIINYQLTSSFDLMMTQAINNYNEQPNSIIKILTQESYNQWEEKNKLTKLPDRFSLAFQRGNIVTIYSAENKKTIKSLINEKKICSSEYEDTNPTPKCKTPEMEK